MALIAWWKLDGNAEDSIGDNHGTVIGSPSIVNGLIGEGFEFTTNSQYINIPHNEKLSRKVFGVSNVFSLCGWVYPTSLENWACIINKAFGGSWSNTTSGLWVYQNAVRFVLGSNEGGNPSGSSTGPSFNITPNNWYHVVGVADGTNLNLYVNGVFRGSSSISDVTRPRSENTQPITIGRRSTGTNPTQKGIIQDVRIYDHALSLKEIKEIYRGLVNHYTLNGNAYDSSGFGNDGVETNVVYSTNSKIGSHCFEGNGTNRSISVSNSTNVIYNQTICMWLYPTNFSARRNPWNRAYGGEGTITQETSGAFNYFWGTHGGNNTPYQGVGSGATISLNQWSHIAVVRNLDTGRIKWYINGVETNDVAASYSAAAVSTANLIIGTGYTNPYAGRIDDVRQYATALSAEDIMEIYRQRGSIDSKGNFSTKELIETSHKPLIMDYTIWEDGQTGSVGSFSQNGSTSENYRILGQDPWGKETVLWEARPDSVSGPDGGWNHNISAANTDNTKMYRFSVWVNRTVTGNGSFYLGCNGFGSTNGVFNRSNGSNNTNPYFWVGTPSQGVWTLVVGHVWPAGSGTGSQHPDSGRYTVSGGKIGNISNDFVWRTETTSSRHRSYLYYSTNTNTRQRWAYPRVDIIDGTEPSIAELLAGFDSNHIDYVRAKGGTEYISFDVNSKLTYAGDLSEVGPSEGLVGWWPLNGDTEDMSGEGNNGVNNGATVVAGLNQLAYEFDEDHIDIGDVDFDYEEFTVSVWAKAKTNDPGNPDFPIHVTNIIGKGNWNSTNNWYIGFKGSGTSPANNLSFVYGISWGSGPSFNVNNFNLSDWNHYVGVANSDEQRLYLNGVLVNTVSTSHGSVENSNILQIARSSYTSRFFKGKIQDVRIYNRALSDEEVRLLFELSGGSDKVKMKKTKTGIYIKGEFVED